jgi:hypothetical protein
MEIKIYQEAIIEVNEAYLLVRCGRCQGTGSRDRDGRDPKCSVCDGIGKVMVRIKPNTNSYIRCGFCKGDGTRDKDGRDPVCPVCNGIGGIFANLPAVSCSKCAGTCSRDKDGKTPICNVCSGTGVISVNTLKTY